MPFIAEEIYRGLVLDIDKKAPSSIHLTYWPAVDKKRISDALDEQMDLTRRIVEAGLSERNAAKIKVRQPLATLSVTLPNGELSRDLKSIILEEVNIKKIDFKKGSTVNVKLDTQITKELQHEGWARDFIRFIQDGRKKAGFNVEDRIKTFWFTEDQNLRDAISTHSEYIARETLSTDFEMAERSGEYQDYLQIDGKNLKLSISRS
jgi:isoleucyl-tRNA synthetase